MDNMIFVKNFSLPSLNIKEVLRYMRAGEQKEETVRLILECAEKLDGKLKTDVCFREILLTETEETLDLSFCKSCSKDLKKNLKGCEKAVVFAATTGFEIDRMISKYECISPFYALVFDAIGSERIESLCDVFNEFISRKARENGEFTRPRFSAGYGDFPIEFQKEIFSFLDCSKKIGLTLNESMIMSPSKSVTGIIGIGKSECERKEGCADCDKTDCEYRRKV